MKKLKNIPVFKSEEEERAFWETHDSTEYLDWNRSQAVTFPNLKPTQRTISIRLPEMLIAEIKVLANREDIPYQSMLKILLAEKVRERSNTKLNKHKVVQQ